ncbi:MAG: EAL domain-containing protein [Gammaproteobacteria bacterium]|jgi:diguanylate cyclase (GGDEF)-like protein
MFHTGLRGLRARLMALVLLALLPAVLMALVSGWQERSVLARQAQDQAVMYAESALGAFNERITESRDLLEVLAQSLPADMTDCDAFMRDVLARHHRYVNLGMFAPDGRVVCSALPVDKSASASDRDYFRQAVRTGRLSLGDFEVGRISHQPVMVLALSLRNRSTRNAGVLFAALNLRWLQHLGPSLSLPKGTSVTILDDDGRVLSRNLDSGRWLGKSVGGQPLADHIMHIDDEGVSELRGLDGRRRLFGFAVIRNNGDANDGYLAIGIPSSVVDRPIQALILHDLTGLGAALVILLGIGWLASKRLILDTARRVVDAAQRLSSGDLGARTGVPPGTDELSLLARTFDLMADSLQQKSVEQARYTAQIERLNRVHRVLSGINSVILRARNRQLLLHDACHIAVGAGGFRAAWIGLLSDDRSEVTGKASAGIERFRTLNVSLDEHAPDANGCIARAVRTHAPVVANEIRTDKNYAYWHKITEIDDIGSMAALPLMVDGRLQGVFALFASETDFFDSNEMRLLEDLAADTGLALALIDKQSRLDFLASHDPLTHLPNQQAYEARMDLEIAALPGGNNSLSAAVAIEIAEFHKISEAISGSASDQILQSVAEYLRTAIRPEDTAAFIRGGEFALGLVNREDVEDVERTVWNILSGLPRTLEIAEEEFAIRLRAGIAVTPKDSREGCQLLERAQLALRSLAPDNRAPDMAFFSQDLDESMRRRRRIESALRKTLRENRPGIDLHFQPVVALEDFKVIGAEALARWHEPRLGTVPPSDFIAVAEHAGLIGELGDRIQIMAIGQARRWSRTAHAVTRVAFNVSALQLRDPDFPARLREALGDNQEMLPLAVEITETQVMTDITASIKCLEELRAMGLLIYVDDFGTGHSSLAYLRELPMDVLKIDRRFVDRLATDRHDVRIAESIMDLARYLGIRVIAEGVETPAQLEILQHMGCYAVQGYLFSKPLPVKEFEALPAVLEPAAHIDV